MPDLRDPIIIKRHYGMFSSVESEAIPDGYYANLLNINCGSIGSIAPDKGYTKYGYTNVSDSEKVIACPKEAYKLKDKSIIDLKVVNLASSAILMWLNPNDTANDINGRWEQLLGSLTKDKRMWFAPFNTTDYNRLYFSNGVENLSYWNGATTYLTAAASSGATTLNVGDTTNFDDTGTLIIRLDDGSVAEVAYSGKTSITFTGVTGVTDDIAIYRGVAQKADTTTLSAAPKIINMKTIEARLVGSVGNTFYGSEVADGTDWTIPNPVTLSSPFFRDFPEGDGNIESIEKLGDWIIIGKSGRILQFKLSFTESTLDPQEIIEELDGDYGPVSDNFVKIDKNTISYITSDGQVRLIQQNQQNDRLTATPLNDEVSMTMKESDFTDCQGIYWRKERMLLYTFKRTSSSDENDLQFKCQFVVDRENNMPARPQLSFKDWVANCFSVSEGKLIFHNSYTQDSFIGFDGYTADGAPFNCIATSKRYALNGGFKEVEMLYVPLYGYLASGQVLRFELDYDNEGSRSHKETTFDPTNDTDDAKKVVSPQLKTIGAFAIGNEPIGGTISEIAELNFFRLFFTTPSNDKPYDIQFTIYSNGTITINESVEITGNRWKINTFGFDRRDANTQVDKRLKKNFS